MLSKGKMESIMTPFKIKHHMVCLNLLKQDKSPHFAKTNEIQVQMRVCLLVQKTTKVHGELHRQTEHGMLSWLTSKARPQAAKRQAPANRPVSAALGISALPMPVIAREVRE